MSQRSTTPIVAHETSLTNAPPPPRRFWRPLLRALGDLLLTLPTLWLVADLTTTAAPLALYDRPNGARLQTAQELAIIGVGFALAHLALRWLRRHVRFTDVALTVLGTLSYPGVLFVSISMYAAVGGPIVHPQFGEDTMASPPACVGHDQSFLQGRDRYSRCRARPKPEVCARLLAIAAHPPNPELARPAEQTTCDVAHPNAQASDWTPTPCAGLGLPGDQVCLVCQEMTSTMDPYSYLVVLARDCQHAEYYQTVGARSLSDGIEQLRRVP